jgi:hypothetical protein
MKGNPMNKPDERISLLEDVIDVLSRYVTDDLIREDIYNELVYTFRLEAEDDNLLGTDPVFDKVFKEVIYDDADAEEEEVE